MSAKVDALVGCKKCHKDISLKLSDMPSDTNLNARICSFLLESWEERSKEVANK